MPEAARLNDTVKCNGDSHGCPACPHVTRGPVMTGSTDVFVNGRPAARTGDTGMHVACCGPNTFEVTGGSGTVFINGKGAARKGDSTGHCGGQGKVEGGSGDVIIG